MGRFHALLELLDPYIGITRPLKRKNYRQGEGAVPRCEIVAGAGPNDECVQHAGDHAARGIEGNEMNAVPPNVNSDE